MFARVAGCSHICASIAGATTIGAVVASAVSASMSSASPNASRAIVVALAGAISSASAARASATCSSASADCGSYMSVNTGRCVSARNVSGVDELLRRVGEDDVDERARLRQLAGNIRRLVAGDAPG